MSRDNQVPSNAVGVTPSMTVDQPGMALYCGGAGNVALEPSAAPGQSVTFAVLAGSTIVLRFTKVYSVGTTATGLVRLW